MSHHLGDALYRDASAERQRPERVTRHVERQSLPDATRPARGAQSVIHHTTAATAWEDKGLAFFFHRLLFLAFIEDRFRNRM